MKFVGDLDFFLFSLLPQYNVYKATGSDHNFLFIDEKGIYFGGEK